METIQSPGRTDRRTDWMVSHLEMRSSEKTVEMREVYDRMPRPRGLPHHKQTAVKARRRQRSKLHSTLGDEGKSDLLQSNPLGGHGDVQKHGDGLLRQWRNPGKGYTIPQPDDLHHPRIRAPVPPGLPMEGQTTAGEGQTEIWLLLPETRRFGRRSPTLATLETLTATTPRRRSGALTSRLAKRAGRLVT